MDLYYPTGNEFIALPTVNAENCAVEAVNFLSMAQRGMVELRGKPDAPFLQPFVQIERNGMLVELPLTAAKCLREHFWIPVLTAEAEGITLSMTVLTPVEERGFALRLSVSAKGDAVLRFGLRGCWADAWHCVNEEKRIEGHKSCYPSGWNDAMVFDFRLGFPLFAFAPMCNLPVAHEFREDDDAISFTMSRRASLTAGTEESLVVFWGFGFEEVAAATSAKEMLRRGWSWEYQKTAAWLDARAHSFHSEKLTELYNTNLFFCIFFATGRTLDTEELVCMTSRSPRYYVSAAYWDRDVLLWAFPAILDADPALAEEILEYVFTRQRRNLGVHSRYIDGTVLEPGFELDELVAPIIALSAYLEVSGDRELLQEQSVLCGIDGILTKLALVKHPETELFETFLQPTDDERVYPYLTYDNVLVWLALSKLAELLPTRYAALSAQAERVRAAIYQNCVFTDEAGRAYFGWSVDLEGHHDIYDEPPGSLQLLPYYGFCGTEDSVWQNSVRKIRSPAYAYSFADQAIAEIGCPHAPYPWVLSLCNSLLCGHEEQALQELEVLVMDNGIACESVDPVSGECTTGAAFATCAGFLCHSLRHAEQEARNAK